MANTVEIDRVVLDGLDVTPGQAERIRALLEVALQQELAQGAWPRGVAGGQVRSLEAPAIRVDGQASDDHLAGSLGHSIAQAVCGTKVK